MGRALFFFLTIVYVSGCAALNAMVRAACTHGNCVHGWYSQDTVPEQAMFMLWAIGFPAAVWLVTAYATETNHASKAVEVIDPAGLRDEPEHPLPTSEARARKKWTCEQCDVTIHRGERYRYYESGFGKDTVRVRFCERCARQALDDSAKVATPTPETPPTSRDFAGRQRANAIRIHKQAGIRPADEED